MLPGKSGFTLIELLVVIAILAILSVVSISVFANAQISAKDTKRRSEILAISKSLEASLNSDDNTYINNLSKDFPDGVPTDPKNTINYCIKTSASIESIENPAPWTSGCPTDPTGWSIVSTAFTSTVKSWKVCAKLEKDTTTLFCKASLNP